MIVMILQVIRGLCVAAPAAAGQAAPPGGHAVMQVE